MFTFEPNPVQPSENLSHYLFAESHYDAMKKRVIYTAFMPRSDDLRVSVFRTSGLDEQYVWSIGEDVGQKSNRTLRARGDIIAVEVRKLDLDIDPDNNPPRHANIIGWPQDKPKRQLIAQGLASVATLKLGPPQSNKG